MPDSFWAVVDAQLKELESAKTADDVLRILSHERDPYYTELGQGEGHGPSRSADTGFFAGSGGDGSVMESLRTAGWEVIWASSSYFWAMRAPDGSAITYIGGDIQRGNQRPI